MSLNLDGFDDAVSDAVRTFWSTRESAIEAQLAKGIADRGGRAGVTSGKNMDGFVALVADMVRRNGLPDAQIFLSRGVTTLPGYFRPTKDWDLVVMHRGMLVAAIELKSHVGPSFGNNFNNRAEEAIGSAVDLWTAYREGSFGSQPRPFLGWIMHVEDTPKSRQPVRVLEPHFTARDEYRNASNLERYDNLCRRLVLENLYTNAAVITSTRGDGPNGVYQDASPDTSLRRFMISLAAHVAGHADLP